VASGGWRKRNLGLSLALVGARLSVAGLLLVGANNSLQNAVAEGDTRTLSFHHVHTGEDITVTFKRDGRYDEAALEKLDWFMRDWRKGQAIHMDPHLFDLLWETYRAVGGKEPIQVVCGYRSPGTNAMLRARSRASGVAQFSQHINGNAIDFYIPGVSLAAVRAEGLRLQEGGVGFYPTSGSPFVHLDTGAVRHWPRIARAELVKIFPNGRTVHIPSDGRPLPGYALALADVESHGAVPSEKSLATARAAGVISAGQVQVAEREQPRRRGLLARIFGRGQQQHEPSEQVAAKRGGAAMALASLSPAKTALIQRVVPLPAARPESITVASIMPRPRPEILKSTATEVASNDFASANYWLSPVAIESALPAPIVAAAPVATAAPAPMPAGGTGSYTLAYAEPETPLAMRTRPMGSRLPRMPAEADVIHSPDSSAVVEQPVASAAAGSERFASPWLRAAVLTPSVRGYMTTTRVGGIDVRWEDHLLYKPTQSVMMTFSADPHLGMVSDRFTGTAVVFLATVTFTPAQTTASLP